MRRARTAPFALLLLALIAAGCGTASSPTVKLSLTAPTEGATVVESSLYALGTVDPPGAAVLVSGKRVQVTNGAFRERVMLHRGQNHLTLVASAPGYVTTSMSLAVRSEPTGVGQASAATNEGSNFRDEANRVCEEGKAEVAPHTVAGMEAQNRANVRRLNVIAAPASEAHAWAAYRATIEREQRPFAQVLAALQAHEVARAYHFNAETKALQHTANRQAASLGLGACVVPLP